MSDQTPAHKPQLEPLTMLEWARERLDNTLRIADTKSGLERDGWLVDAAYWKAIVTRLDATEDLLAACREIASFAVAWEPLSVGDIAVVHRAIAKAEGR